MHGLILRQPGGQLHREVEGVSELVETICKAKGRPLAGSDFADLAPARSMPGGGNPAAYWALPFDERCKFLAPPGATVRDVSRTGLHRVPSQEFRDKDSSTPRHESRPVTGPL